jgi:phage portal protein BeeE
MSLISGLFRSRDKPTNSTNGSGYRCLFGGSNSGKNVNERSAMQMTAVYACVRILSESIVGLPVHLYQYKHKTTPHHWIFSSDGEFFLFLLDLRLNRQCPLY